MARIDKMWMCILVHNSSVSTTRIDTLKWTRKESIDAMLYNKSGRPAYSWVQLRKFGWRCIKVNLSFEI